MPTGAARPSYDLAVHAFTLLSELSDQQTIAEGAAIRELPRLVKTYGAGTWRKRKGYALVELTSGPRRRAELHWYEAHGVGRKELKLKRYVD